MNRIETTSIAAALESAAPARAPRSLGARVRRLRSM